MRPTKSDRHVSASAYLEESDSDEEPEIAIEETTENPKEIASDVWNAGKAKRKANKHNFKALKEQSKFALKLVKYLAKKLPEGDEDISQPAAIALLNAPIFLNGLKGLCYLLSDVLNDASAANAALFGDVNLTTSVANYVGKNGNNLVFVIQPCLTHRTACLLLLIDKREGKTVSDAEIDADVIVMNTALRCGKEADKSFERIFPSSMINNIVNYTMNDHVNTKTDSGLSALLMLLYIGFFSTNLGNVDDKRRLKFVSAISEFASNPDLLVGLRGLGLALFSASENPVRVFHGFHFVIIIIS